MTKNRPNIDLEDLGLDIQPGELEKPAVPIDFSYNILACWGGDCLMEWFFKNNIPLEVRELFNAVMFFGMFRTEAATHDGLVSKALNEDAPHYLTESLRCMTALGWKW
jgi:hypothetical protein